jgi:hypothetical protein
VLFGPFERLGFHVVGDHFYEPIPNLRELEANYDESPHVIPGHPINLTDFETAHAARLTRYGPEFKESAGKFGFYFDTDSVVEIGQGTSTRIALAALERNSRETGNNASFVSIDPYTRLLADTLKPEHVRFEQIHQTLQEVPVDDLLKRCQGNALLFGDCSHVYKPGSDVWHLMHKIYPRLPIGCTLHAHDITLPHPWPKDFYVQNKWFWNEQDMLEAFLAFNSAFQITLPVYWLHRDSALVRQTIAEVAPDLHRRDTGYSFYLKRVA